MSKIENNFDLVDTIMILALGVIFVLFLVVAFTSEPKDECEGFNDRPISEVPLRCFREANE